MLLMSEGYQVAAAATMTEALKQARLEPQIAALVTDYHLSEGETGTQVIAALQTMLGRPLKAILVTGDTSPVIKELSSDPSLRIVSKPVNADELLGILRELVDS
jgi:CheY-like chemotaxis protein